MTKPVSPPTHFVPRTPDRVFETEVRSIQAICTAEKLPKHGKAVSHDVVAANFTGQCMSDEYQCSSKETARMRGGRIYKRRRFLPWFSSPSSTKIPRKHYKSQTCPISKDSRFQKLILHRQETTNHFNLQKSRSTYVLQITRFLQSNSHLPH